MFDPTRLSEESRSLLTKMAQTDGNAGNLSNIDLTHASPVDLADLMASLEKDGYDANEQALTQIVLHLTDKWSHSGKSSRSYDFDSGRMGTVSFADSPLGLVPGFLTNKGVRQVVMAESHLHLSGSSVSKNELDASYFTSGAAPSDFVVAPTRIDAALAARERLAKHFHFAPDNPYDLAAVKAMRKDLGRAEIPEFLELYKTAFYEHPGEGTDWSWLANVDAKHVLFGDPPKLDQLPDGRRLVDCQGFCRITEILVDTLLPGRDPGTTFFKAVRLPGHELGIFRDGDKTYISDNDNMREVDLTDGEIEQLQYLASGKHDEEWPFPTDWDGDGLPRKDFPGLYAYMDKHHEKLSGGTLEWDEGDILLDG